MSLDIDLYVDVDTGGDEPERFQLFTANYTHNAGKMAAAAGIYQCVWRPEEMPEITCAGDLIEPLSEGIDQMMSDPAKFIALQPANGWGSYKSFLTWLEEYLEACIKHPKALIEADS